MVDEDEEKWFGFGKIEADEDEGTGMVQPSPATPPVPEVVDDTCLEGVGDSTFKVYEFRHCRQSWENYFSHTDFCPCCGAEVEAFNISDIEYNQEDFEDEGKDEDKDEGGGSAVQGSG